MKFQKIFLSGLAIFHFCFCYSQTITQKTFETAIPYKLHQIAAACWEAGIKGKVKCYASDSLNDWLTPEESYRRGGQLIIKITQNWRNPNDPDDLVDTAWYETLNSEKILPDLDLIYEIETDANLNKKLIFRAVAPLYKLFAVPYDPVKYIPQPVFWIKTEDLTLVLDSQSIAFIREYAWWNSTVTTSKPEAVWANAVGLKQFKIAPDSLSFALGKFLYKDLKRNLFKSFQDQKYKLKSQNVEVNWAEFVARHKEKIFIQIPNEKNPDDPTDLVDTSFWELPLKFDSMYFEGGQNPQVIFVQRTHKANIIEWLEYKIALIEVRQFMHPAHFRMLAYLLSRNE